MCTGIAGQRGAAPPAPRPSPLHRRPSSLGIPRPQPSRRERAQSRPPWARSQRRQEPSQRPRFRAQDRCLAPVPAPRLARGEGRNQAWGLPPQALVPATPSHWLTPSPMDLSSLSKPPRLFRHLRLFRQPRLLPYPRLLNPPSLPSQALRRPSQWLPRPWRQLPTCRLCLRQRRWRPGPCLNPASGRFALGPIRPREAG